MGPDVVIMTHHLAFEDPSIPVNALPDSVQTAARRGVREIWEAQDKRHAERALDVFARDFAKWPKAVAKLTKDREAVIAFYHFPAEHWIHLRTSNPIESTFSPCGLGPT